MPASYLSHCAGAMRLKMDVHAIVMPLAWADYLAASEAICCSGIVAIRNADPLRSRRLQQFVILLLKYAAVVENMCDEQHHDSRPHPERICHIAKGESEKIVHRWNDEPPEKR